MRIEIYCFRRDINTVLLYGQMLASGKYGQLITNHCMLPTGFRVGDIAVALNERPSVNVLCASSNR